MIEVLDQPRVLTPLRLRPSGVEVRYRTALCDAKGRVERVLQSGRNLVTDFGMNQLGSANIAALVTHLNLSSATQTLKRVPLAGNVLTVNSSGGAGSLAVACTSNFFEAGDVGRTLKIDGWPELLVTAFTDAQHVTASARAAEWLPGFTPDTDPHDGDWGVHYTETATLGAEFTRFGTFDTASANNNAVLNDSANSRWVHQRIWLSGVVSGGPWTVNQLGWSANSANCFGKANLNSPDVIPNDKRYRVELQVRNVVTPINLTGVSLDFGPIVGTHLCDIRMERVYSESGGVVRHFLIHPPAGSAFAWYQTAAYTMQSVLWEGDAGFGNISNSNPAGGQELVHSAYVSGSHKITRSLRYLETVNMANATALFAARSGTTDNRFLTIKPQSGTITKPTGWRIEVQWPIRWTRELVN